MISEIIQRQKDYLLKSLWNLVIEIFPAESHTFLDGKKDRFQNPLGSNIDSSLTKLVNLLGNENSDDGFKSHSDQEKQTDALALDSIIRIMAVQDIPPSKGLSFLFQIKPILQEMVAEEGKNLTDKEKQTLKQELQSLDNKIDQLALKAFDQFCLCRQKIYKIQISEIKKRSYKLWERISCS